MMKSKKSVYWLMMMVCFICTHSGVSAASMDVENQYSISIKLINTLKEVELFQNNVQPITDSDTIEKTTNDAISELDLVSLETTLEENTITLTFTKPVHNESTIKTIFDGLAYITSWESHDNGGYSCQYYSISYTELGDKVTDKDVVKVSEDGLTVTISFNHTPLMDKKMEVLLQFNQCRDLVARDGDVFTFSKDDEGNCYQLITLNENMESETSSDLEAFKNR